MIRRLSKFKEAHSKGELGASPQHPSDREQPAADLVYLLEVILCSSHPSLELPSSISHQSARKPNGPALNNSPASLARKIRNPPPSPYSFTKRIRRCLTSSKKSAGEEGIPFGSSMGTLNSTLTSSPLKGSPSNLHCPEVLYVYHAILENLLFAEPAPPLGYPETVEAEPPEIPEPVHTQLLESKDKVREEPYVIAKQE